ncbi:MAG: ABC transporter permease [Bacillota bacterium]
MKLVFNILKEQVQHLPLIVRLSSYDIKSKYQMHYLGILWQFINPAFQVMIYWFVFGLGLREGKPMGEVPYFIWLIIGLIPWFFISLTIIQGSNSIYNRVNLVAKMKFPVSVLPTITLVSNSMNFLFMLIILGFVLLINNINPGIYLFQLPYYMFSLFVFLFSVTLLSSTISAIIRDFQLMLQSFVRMLFFLTPILWDIENFSDTIQSFLKLNPLIYLISGFRDTFMSEGWFFEDMTYTIYFWSTTLLILFIGSILHENFKNKFVDYL